MEKNSFIIFLLLGLLLSFEGNAQTKENNTVKGRVLEYETGKPLENVNVYISGTTWGTTTDQAGNFEIKNIPSGIQQIVASIIGYESRTKSLHLSNGKTYILTFQLPVTHYELEAVNVSGEVPAAWKRNYQLFEKWFLGSSEFASNCVIENPEVINFTWTNKNHLTA